MEFVSSDANVWIDFRVIFRLNLPFRLPYTYIMYTESIDSELLTPADFRYNLIAAGLVGVDITTVEFELAESWGKAYPKLSVQDRIALAIAKERKIVLLSGDKPLREVAAQEGVTVFGTIGVLDKLYEGKYIPKEEYAYCLSELLKHNGREVRLPASELRKRLDSLKKGTERILPVG